MCSTRKKFTAGFIIRIRNREFAFGGILVTVPIGKGTHLSLSATVAAAPGAASTATWIDPARYLAWGFGGVLLVAYVLGLVARRRT